jgi:hypothetical protein
MNRCKYLVIVHFRRRRTAGKQGGRPRARGHAMCLAGTDMVPCQVKVAQRGGPCTFYQLKTAAEDLVRQFDTIRRGG